MYNNQYMNKLLFIFGFLLILWNPIYSQEPTQNYIRTRVMLNESGSSYMDEIVYYDGLGRPFQTVQKTWLHVPCGNPCACNN